MISTQDLQFFAVVASAPSLAAAARALDVTPPAVTQRLRQLEHRLQVRLVERSSRRLRLTEEGALLADKGAAIVGDIEAIVDELSRRRSRVTGCLRVAAPFGFGRVHIAPAMALARARHPELDLRLWLFEDPAGSLNADNWDVLIHVGPLADSRLTMRRLAPNRRILCAAPAYLDERGRPDHPDDLAGHDCGVIREDQADVSLWSFTARGGATQTVRIHPRFASNDGMVVRDWTLAGLGLALRSEWDVADSLRDGRLVELLPDWRALDADVVALLGSRSERLARTDAFLAAVTDVLRPPPWRRRARLNPSILLAFPASRFLYPAAWQHPPMKTATAPIPSRC